MAKNYSPVRLLGAVKMYTKTEAMSEVKDISKNLMNDDHEREYRLPERKRRKQWSVNALALAVGILTGCLVVLTVIREVQLARLRRQVDELTANIIAVNANIESLNRKIVKAEKLADEFGTLDDTVFADDDNNISIEDSKDSTKDKSLHDSLHQLQGVTVLEDEDDDDLEVDDENYDDDIANSGFYSDYDVRRRKKIGTPNMVHLRPEDFVESQITLTKDNNIGEIKRILNENPENPDLSQIALARSTVATQAGPREKRSFFPDAVAAAAHKFSIPRLMAKSEERRKSKKFVATETSSPYSDNIQTPRVTSTVSRITRNSNDLDSGERRPFIAAHFHGNTSHLNPEIHEHYKGNGLVRVPHDSPHDVWYPSPWTLSSPHPRPTLTRNGHVHVHHTGVYLVYVQIYYLDSHDVISWVLDRTNSDIEGRETLLQCAQSAHTPETMDKPNSCFSASALFLKAGDRLAVRNTGGDRHSLMQPEKSFIGLIKLADAEDPEQEF